MKFYSHFSVDSVHEAHQVHGSQFTRIQSRSSCYRGVDGLFGARAGAMLTLRTADCFPVFVREASGKRFGLLHAGWRGLSENIITKALNCWFERPVEIILGAGVAPSDYEVEEDVVKAFSEGLNLNRQDLIDQNFLSEDFLDLTAIIEWEAQRADPDVRSLFSFPFSTSSTDEGPPLLSYREDRTEDRMVSWIYRRKR